ncbi:MAG: histidinol-phosphatase [Treponema sp.]|nr:histidinol-phosphatase [Treponema sp.]
MQLACIHTHTVFCDGKDDVESCCLAAYNKGLSAIGFSSHAPVKNKTGFPNECHVSEERLPEYMETVLAAKRRWEGRLPVYLGLEVDFVQGLMGPADRDFQTMGLDFIIGSVHIVLPQRGGPFSVDDHTEKMMLGIKEGYGGDPMGMVEAYFDAQQEMIRAGGFDFLAHPDLVKKNRADIEGRGVKFFSEEDSLYREKTSALAALMAGAGVPAEVNTGGMNRGKTLDCYPSLPLLKLFRENAVPMVINADAHKAEDLDGHHDEARKTMLAAGYTETVLFGGRQNGKAVWSSVKL